MSFASSIVASSSSHLLLKKKRVTRSGNATSPKTTTTTATTAKIKRNINSHQQHRGQITLSSSSNSSLVTMMRIKSKSARNTKTRGAVLDVDESFLPWKPKARSLRLALAVVPDCIRVRFGRRRAVRVHLTRHAFGILEEQKELCER